MRNEGKRTEDGVVWGGDGGEGKRQREWEEGASALSFLRDKDLELHRAHGSRH